MFVSEIIEDVVEILGQCDRTLALRRLSDAVAALQDEGDWKANIGYLDIRTHSDERTITLPRQVETPLAVSINRRPVYMRDQFFQFHLNGDGVNKHTVPWVWDDRAFTPTYTNLWGPSTAVALALNSVDVGTELRLLGFDQSGFPLRSQQEDGSWIPGIVLSVQPLSSGTTPPDSRVFNRIFTVSAMTQFSSTTPHELVTGDFMQVSLLAGALPVPLADGGFYYVRVVDDTYITLHRSRLDSRTGQSPIEITSGNALTEITLSDVRSISVRTQFKTATGPSLIPDRGLVTFTGSPLPTGIDSTTTYVARSTGADTFAIYANADAANLQISPINVSDAGSSIVARSLVDLDPITPINFPVKHNMLTGDSVTARNSGGELPSPLVNGATYYFRPIDSRTGTLHASLSDSLTGDNPIVLTTPGSGTSSIAKIIPASVTTGSVNNVTAVGHNLNTPTGGGASGTAVLTGPNVTSITVGSGGSGYETPPKVVLSGGGGTGALATANLTGGVVTSFTIVSGGAGYSSPPTVTITGAAGSLVQFTTTGTLPDPISQGTVYRAEAPMSADTFTLNDTSINPINITSLGSGSLFLVISRSFSVGFNGQWKTDATNRSTGDQMRFFTEGVLPVTSPSTDQTTVYYIRKITAQAIEIYDTLIHAQDLVSTTGRIVPVSLGAGDLYLSTDVSVTTVLRDSLLNIEFSGYISSLADIKFSTTGTLPAPLNTTDTFQANIVGGALEVRDSGGTVVTLTTVGSGLHKMLLERDMKLDLASSLDVPEYGYFNGDSVTANSTETLASPLSTIANYYVRGIGDGKIELYDTEAHAVDTANTTGRISYLSVGSGVQRLSQILPAWEISKITQVEKPVTTSRILLHAYDPKRIEKEEDPYIQLGEYLPDDQRPMFRQIQVGVKCAHVRMKHRLTTVEITSEQDFINLNSKLAITMMVKSHELLRTNFVDEAERYRRVSVDFLNKRDRSTDGPVSIPMQFDNDTMGVSWDVMVD